VNAKQKQPTIDVSDRGGAIFAAGAASFQTVRKARPELVQGAIVRVREETGRRMFNLVDRGEWVIRVAQPVNNPNGPDPRVRLVLQKLEPVYVRAPRGGGLPE